MNITTEIIISIAIKQYSFQVTLKFHFACIDVILGVKNSQAKTKMMSL